MDTVRPARSRIACRLEAAGQHQVIGACCWPPTWPPQERAASMLRPMLVVGFRCGVVGRWAAGAAGGRDGAVVGGQPGLGWAQFVRLPVGAGDVHLAGGPVQPDTPAPLMHPRMMPTTQTDKIIYVRK